MINTAEVPGLPKEKPCKHAHVVTEPKCVDKQAHRPTSQIKYPLTSKECKPCSHVVEVEQSSARTDPRTSRCKSEPKTDDHTTKQIEASTIRQVDERAKARKCNQISKPAVSDTEKPPCKSNVSAHPPVEAAGQFGRGKPCDELKTPTKDLVTVADKTQQPTSSGREKPCKKNTTLEQLIAESTKKQPMAKSSNKEPTVPSKATPCEKNKAIESDPVTKPEGSKEVEITQNAETNKMPKQQKPCKPKTVKQATVRGRKRCKDKPPLVSGAQKQSSAKTDGAEEPRCLADITDSVVAYMSQTSSVVSGRYEDEVSKPEDKQTQNAETKSTERKPCKEKKTQEEFSRTKKATEPSPGAKDVNKRKPCRPKAEAEVLAPDEQAIARKIKRCKDKASLEFNAQQLPAVAAVAVQLASFSNEEETDNQLNVEQQHDQEPEDRCPNTTDSVIAWMSQTSAAASGQNEASGSIQTLQEPCLSAEEVTEVIQTTVQGPKCHELSDREEIREAEEKERTIYDIDRCGCHELSDYEEIKDAKEKEETANDTDRCGGHELSHHEEIWKAQEEEQNRNDVERCGCPDTEKAETPEKTETGQEKVAESRNEEVANRVDELTSTYPEENNKSNPAQNADEQLDANKRPCQKSRMPTSDQSVESTTRLFSRCKQARILKLFKYQKKSPCKSTVLPDSSESLQSGSSGRSPYPSTVDYESNQDVNRGISDKKLTESPGGADSTVKTTNTEENVQSFTTDAIGTGTRRALSDDHDVLTHRQNMSSEVLLHTSEPTLDSLAELVHIKTEKSTKPARKDSGPQPVGTTKPLAVPKTVAEGLAVLDTDSSDTTSEVIAQENVPKKLDSSQQYRVHTVEDGHDRSSTKRRDSGKTRPVRRKERKVPDKVAEDPDESESWDSTEESASETSPQVSQPNVSCHCVAAESSQDADKNNCDRTASYEAVDSEWSDSICCQPSDELKQKTSDKSVAKQQIERETNGTDRLDFDWFC